MSQDHLAITIMAAGKGTRLKSKRPKVLHEIGGRALLLHVIDAAKQVVPAEQIYCVIGHEAERVQAAIESTGVSFVLQPEQRGTGHALQMVKAYFELNVSAVPENLLVLSGDVPLIRPETIEAIYAAHLANHAAMAILTAIPPDPTGYGRVLRVREGSPEVTAIVEQKSLRPEHGSPREINSGIYCFRTASLFHWLDSLTDENSARELYLTDIAAMLVADGQKVIAIPADSVDEVLGANTIAEMMHLDATMRLDKARRLMAGGVTIFRPETCTIDSEVEVAADTVIEPYVQLLGATKIGSECRIRSHSVIQDSVLGDGVLVKNGCILDQSEVRDGAVLGPYAHLRPGTYIAEEAHLGNFAEAKKLRLGRGSKAHHVGYLGDTTIGENVNIGAGTIVCNYDGVLKHPTRVGDNVFVGSNSTLVAPVSIADRAYVAAGSVITDNVPEDALALGRARQVVKEEWAKKRREASHKKED